MFTRREALYREIEKIIIENERLSLQIDELAKTGDKFLPGEFLESIRIMTEQDNLRKRFDAIKKELDSL